MKHRQLQFLKTKKISPRVLSCINTLIQVGGPIGKTFFSEVGADADINEALALGLITETEGSLTINAQTIRVLRQLHFLGGGK
jgi:hypothetical protein